MPLTKATQNVVEGIVSTGSTGISAGSFIVGQQYKITSLGTTTQAQWNTIAGTIGQTYVVGSMFTAATTGASSGNGAAAVARTLANRFADVVNVKDFGAVGDGVADDTAAIQAAVDAAAGRPGGGVVESFGVCKVSSPISIPKNVTFNFIKLIPSDVNVNLLIVFGGCTINGTIDTSAFPLYSGNALTIDGAGETLGSPFRVDIKTYVNVSIVGGGAYGDSHTGTAIFFKATDTNARIMGVELHAKIDKFQYGVFMTQTSTDLSKFITSNYIYLDTSDTITALQMNSSHVNGYGLDGNNIVAKGQPNNNTTTFLYVICGQDNTFDLLPWDWDALAITSPYAVWIKEFSRRNLIYFHTKNDYILDNSGNINNVIVAPYGGGVSTMVGNNYIFNISNAIGIYAFRRNGVNQVFIDTLGLSPGADNTRYLGTTGARWNRIYSSEFYTTPNLFISSGSGSPEGVLVAPVGSLYTRTNGGTGSTLYVKESGSGNTGWIAK